MDYTLEQQMKALKISTKIEASLILEPVQSTQLLEFNFPQQRRTMRKRLRQRNKSADDLQANNDPQPSRPAKKKKTINDRKKNFAKARQEAQAEKKKKDKAWRQKNKKVFATFGTLHSSDDDVTIRDVVIPDVVEEEDEEVDWSIRMSQARMKALADKPPRSPETESEDSDVSSSLDRVTVDSPVRVATPEHSPISEAPMIEAPSTASEAEDDGWITARSKVQVRRARMMRSRVAPQTASEDHADDEASDMSPLAPPTPEPVEEEMPDEALEKPTEESLEASQIPSVPVVDKVKEKTQPETPQKEEPKVKVHRVSASQKERKRKANLRKKEKKKAEAQKKAELEKYQTSPTCQ